MAQMLIDEFDGDPKELYELIKEEIKKRDIPGVQFADTQEYFSRGWFSANETAPCLIVTDGTHEAKVFAYQFGRSFHLSNRLFWRDYKLAEQQKEGKLDFLAEVRLGLFDENIERAVRLALGRYLEKCQVPVPPNLNPRDIFYGPKTQT